MYGITTKDVDPIHPLRGVSIMSTMSGEFPRYVLALKGLVAPSPVFWIVCGSLVLYLLMYPFRFSRVCMCVCKKQNKSGIVFVSLGIQYKPGLKIKLQKLILISKTHFKQHLFCALVASGSHTMLVMQR